MRLKRVVGFRTYVRSQVGFIVGSLFSAYIFESDLRKNDPELFIEHQIMNISSFMLAGLMVQKGVSGAKAGLAAGRYGQAMVRYINDLKPVLYMTSRVNLNGFVIGMFKLAADLYFSVHINSFLEKSKLQAKLEPKLSKPFNNYIRVLKGDLEGTDDCSGSKELVLRCLSGEIIRGYLANWQELTKYGINKVYERKMIEFMEWESEKRQAEIIYSPKRVSKVIDNYIKEHHVAHIGQAIQRKLYSTGQSLSKHKGYLSKLKVSEDYYRIIHPQEDMEALERGYYDYMKGQYEFNHDFIGDMKEVYGDFVRYLDKDKLYGSRYGALDKLIKAEEEEKEICVDEDHEGVCAGDGEVQRRLDFMDIAMLGDRDLTHTQGRVSRAKEKTFFEPMKKRLGTTFWLDKMFPMTVDHRANPAEMLDMLFQMSQAILGLESKKASVVDVQGHTVEMLLRLYHELGSEVYATLKDPASLYMGRQDVEGIEVHPGFVPAGYDFSNDKIDGPRMSDLMELAPKKYIAVLPEDGLDAGGLNDVLFSRMLGEYLLEHRILGFKGYKESGEVLVEQVQKFLELFVQDKVSVEDMMMSFPIAQHLSEQEIGGLFELVQRYKDMDGDIYSKYACEREEESSLVVSDKGLSQEKLDMMDQKNKRRLNMCARERGIGVQLFYEVTDSGSAKSKEGEKEVILDYYAKNDTSITPKPFLYPMGQMYIHQSTLEALTKNLN